MRGRTTEMQMGNLMSPKLPYLTLIVKKGGAVAEWSKALLKREKINENQKDPWFAPRPGHLLKKNLNCKTF